MSSKYHGGIRLYLKSAWVLGVHPFESSLSQHLLFLFSFGALFGHCILTTVYLLVELHNNRLEMGMVLRCYEAAVGIMHGLIKLLSLRLNRRKFSVLIDKTKQFLDIETHHGEKLIASCEADNKFIKNMLHFLFGALVSTIIAFNASALIFDNETILLLPVYKPSYIPTFVMFLFQNYMVFVLLPTVLGHDGILLTSLIMVKVQFRLLNDKLGKLFVGRKRYEIDLERDIKECIDHHNYILGFVAHINRTFSLTLIFYLGNVILAMCVEFYIVSKQISFGATLKALSYITTILFVLFSFCFVPGQLLANEAEKTSNLIFSNNWEEMSSPSVRCFIKMIINRSQKPVLIQAGGILPINLQSGLATFKTIVSYYMFLNTMTEDVD